MDDVLDHPMVDMAGAPPDWTDFWHLRECRGGPARTVGDPVATQLVISFGDIVAPVCASAWRLSLSAPGRRAIRLCDAPARRWPRPAAAVSAAPTPSTSSTRPAR
jgi:hypothetical protein